MTLIDATNDTAGLGPRKAARKRLAAETEKRPNNNKQKEKKLGAVLFGKTPVNRYFAYSCSGRGNAN